MFLGLYVFLYLQRFSVAFVFGVCVLCFVCIISVNAAFFGCICFQDLFVFHLIICSCFLLMYAFLAVVPRLHLPATVIQDIKKCILHDRSPLR